MTMFGWGPLFTEFFNSIAHISTVTNVALRMSLSGTVMFTAVKLLRIIFHCCFLRGSEDQPKFLYQNYIPFCTLTHPFVLIKLCSDLNKFLKLIITTLSLKFLNVDICGFTKEISHELPVIFQAFQLK